MAGVNKAIILGHLGRDPELTISQTGTSICRFSLAVSEKWGGEDKTEWFNCVAFGKLAEIVDQYLSKGSQAYIEGRIQTSKWEDQNGQARYKTEIIVNNLAMLGGGGRQEPSASSARQSDEKPKGKPSQRGMGFDGRDARSRLADDDPFAGDFGPPPTEHDMPF